MATTPCPHCYHTDEEHEEILRGRQWSHDFHERCKKREAERAAAEAEAAAKRPKPFVCRCGHPGLGCVCW